MIKNIIFDLGGVLVSLNRQNCLNAFSHILGFHDFGDYLSAYAQKGFFAQFEDGIIGSGEFRESVRQYSLNKDITDDQIDSALCAFLTEVSGYKVDFLLELKEKNYKLFLLSNTNPIAWDYAALLFKQAGGVAIDDVFEKLYLSFEMKKSKPGKAIFEQLLSDAGIKAEETLFVDDAAANVDTAREIGFKTLWYDTTTDLSKVVTEVLT